MSDAVDALESHRDSIGVAKVAASMTATTAIGVVRPPGGFHELPLSLKCCADHRRRLPGRRVAGVLGLATFEWLMFGIGAVAVLMSATILLRARGVAQRALDALIGILGAWTVVASLEFAGSTVIWLGFASGAGLVALALIGLTLHELRTERVVHSLEVTTAAEREFAHVG